MTEINQEIHRQMAIDCFNKTWEFMDMPTRDPLQDDEMLQCAIASRYHWGQVGGPLEFARGEWQISRAFALVGKAAPALEHGLLSLMWCENYGIRDFDLAFAYEALARASAVAEKMDDLRIYRKLALEAAEEIAEVEDKAYFLSELDGICA